MIKKVVILVFMFFINFAYSQKNELGKVTIAELQEKVNIKDTNAVATILFKKGKTHFRYEDKKGFRVIHEYNYKIKIYKKAGLKWADFKVPYYIGYEDLSDEKVSFSNANTYNIENGKIIKTKLGNEGSFKNNLSENWSEASITMPNVKVGSIIEFTYILDSENIISFPVFDFQDEVPVNYCEYKTEIPEFFIYKVINIGLIKVKSDVKIENGYQNFSNEHNHTVNLSYQQINSSYISENLPALQEENYLDNRDNYKCSIQHELEKTRFPEVPVKQYAQTWDDVAKSIYKFKEFGNELKERTFFQENLRLIVKNDTTQIQRVKTILNFVQNKIKWDGKYGYLTKKGIKKAYEDGNGNIAEINILLIAMLNHAGVFANPVLTSTVDHGMSTFPNRTVFNYVIAAVDIENERFLLDASDVNSTINILPKRVLNWTGRLIKSDQTSDEINLVPVNLSKENTNILCTLTQDGKISGKVISKKSDYYALSYREKIRDSNIDNYIEKLENDFNINEISNFKIENIATDLSKPVTESYSFLSDNIESINDKVFLNPLFFFGLNNNPFVQEKRQFPIYFGYPTMERKILIFEIPENYKIESIPKSISIKTTDSVLSFNFNATVNDNKIQITTSLEIKIALISADFYDELKEFFQKSIDKQNEKIVLVKK
jgi:hypothetical protein